MHSVARVRAIRSSSWDSGSGVRPAARVSTMVWETSGTVSSIFSAAAAAWNELTPGTTS